MPRQHWLLLQRGLLLKIFVCRHRFITWAGGSVPDALTDYAKAEEDMLDAISTGYRNRNYGTGQIKRAWHETQRKLTRQMQGQPEPVSAYVANMEPNVPSLTADADEGTNLWRHRVRANRRRFMRKQLLVTVRTSEIWPELLPTFVCLPATRQRALQASV